MALTDKQRNFCLEYLKDSNATQAAIRAGYAPRSANRTGSYLLSHHDIKAYLADLMAKEDANKIASAEECRALLTAIARGQTTAEAFRFEGRGRQVKDTVNTPISDRIKAIETLLRGYDNLPPEPMEFRITRVYGNCPEDEETEIMRPDGTKEIITEREIIHRDGTKEIIRRPREEDQRHGKR